MERDPASFRDPSARVFRHGAKVYRGLSQEALDWHTRGSTSPAVQRLRTEGALIDATLLSPSDWPSEASHSGFAGFVEHPRLDLVSYPYEWPFEALRAAAIAHLDLHRRLLADDLTLVDATAFNIQFIHTSPIFVDTPSIRPYSSGEYWLGHDQFLRQFLNPLLLEASTGVSYIDMYRGNFEGLASHDLARLLPFTAKWRPSILTNVVLPARLGRSPRTSKAPAPNKSGLPKSGLIALLNYLSSTIEKLTPRRDESAWSGYSAANSYNDIARRTKAQVVADFCERRRPGYILDVGCNDGEYLFLAIEAGAKAAVGLDTDRASIDRGFMKAAATRAPVTFLHADAANLPPPQGWQGQERSGLRSRLRPDALMALAVVHHLAIGRNIPLDEVVDFLVSWAPAGIIEFVPKNDPMAQLMLSQRADIFPNYSESDFRLALASRSQIVAETVVDGSSRLLFEYQRDQR